MIPKRFTLLFLTGIFCCQGYVTKWPSEAANTTQEQEYPSCPLFYTRVGKDCISFFTPVKVPWAEARQICLSISGDLLRFSDGESYVRLMEYIRSSGLTSDFWVGGRYTEERNAWYWISDETPLKMGSPFWAVRYSSKCIPRSPHQKVPQSNLLTIKFTPPCYNYQQAPQQNSKGWCAALTYELYHYMSDENCLATHTPVCLYNNSQQPHKSTFVQENRISRK